MWEGGGGRGWENWCIYNMSSKSFHATTLTGPAAPWSRCFRDQAPSEAAGRGIHLTTELNCLGLIATVGSKTRAAVCSLTLGVWVRNGEVLEVRWMLERALITVHSKSHPADLQSILLPIACHWHVDLF